MNWYLEVLKKYVEFDGRAHRTEFWMFALFNFIIAIVIGIVLGLVSMKLANTVLALYYLAILLPALGVQVRRLHDIGRSGWWILIGLVPIVGPIVLLIFSVLDSQPGDNEYGPNPKGA